MSTIEALTQWNDGVLEMEKKNYSGAISIFENSPEISAKILFNNASCHFVTGKYDTALQNMIEATKKDEHLALGYYFRGIINFKLSKFEAAAKDFEVAHTKLRGKNVIDYNQLGCRYKFYAFEPLYNCGVTWSRLQARPKALDFLLQAQKVKVEKRHEVVTSTISKADNNERVDILLLPVDAIFRPPKNKVVNIKKKDYLGKAKVISAVDTTDIKPGFEAPRKMSLPVPGMDLSSLSAPNSPNTRRRPSSPNLAPPKAGALKQSSSDTNLSNRDKGNRKRSGAEKKDLPPPPDKPIPQPKSRGGSSGKPLPPPPNKELPQPTRRSPPTLPKSKDLPQPARRSPPILPPTKEAPVAPARTLSREGKDTPTLPARDQEATNERRGKPLPPPPEIVVEDDQPQSVAQRIRNLKVKERIVTSGESAPPPRPARQTSDETRPAPPLPPKDDKPPARGPPNTAPLPPKPKLPSKGRPQPTVTVEISCNSTVVKQVAKGTSLKQLLALACEEFNLEPGTIDLWYSDDGEFVCIENEDEMTRVWAAVGSKLALSCFSQQ